MKDIFTLVGSIGRKSIEWLSSFFGSIDPITVYYAEN